MSIPGMPSLLSRTAHFASPFGQAVSLYTMTGREALGRLYSYEVDLLSRDDSLDLSKLLGQLCAVVLEDTSGAVRYLTGYATNFALVGEHGNFARYRTTLRPFLWFLGQNRNSRIFQRKTVLDIVQEILKDNGFSDIELAVHGHYDPWEFLVQYRESDLNFISRMLEHEGIYYYFKHQEGKHVLVLADSAAAHHFKPGFETVPFYVPLKNETRQVEHLDTWVVSRQLRQGRVQLRDFNFEYPLAFSGEKHAPFPEPGATLELYDYPAQINAKTEDEAKQATNLRAEVRLEEHQADYEVVRAAGPLRGLGAGDKFKLEQFPREDQNKKEHLVVSCS
ncbi:MAG TPA: type VI secretion system tip protein TssI/VgrG, partial [Polyangiaceae bacterium]|nr:type VI secretion system tip protein TssI/VgrG [Polyangiaceae bacterium]